VVLYKDKFSCSPKLHFDSTLLGTIEWTWRTQPPEAIYWKTYKPKKRDIKILTKVTPNQRKEITNELYQEIMDKEHPKKVKQPRVRSL
tara:strand:- start:5550 stop:5813 length:264 start_codon:yes stop_codon:yes gene_type:complete